MTTPVTTVDPTDSLAFAEELMNVERVRHLPVVDGDVLVGMLSQRDILAAAISTLDDPSDEVDLERKRSVQVREVMRGMIETVAPEDDAVLAADRILTHKVGCLPVIDERNHLMGIVTEADFVAIARQALSEGKIHPKPSTLPWVYERAAASEQARAAGRARPRGA